MWILLFDGLARRQKREEKHFEDFPVLEKVQNYSSQAGNQSRRRPSLDYAVGSGSCGTTTGCGSTPGGGQAGC